MKELRQRLWIFGNSTITVMFYCLLGLTTFAAVTHTNLTVGDNFDYGQSTTMITSSLIITVVLLGFAIVTYPRVRAAFVKVFVTHRIATGWTLLALVVIAQLVVVAYVHPNTGFDSGMIYETALDPAMAQSRNVQSYYSQNTNNLPITLLLRQVSLFLGTKSRWVFDNITVFLVDLSAILNLMSLYLIDKRKLGAGLYLHALWLVLFPHILVVYTDTWVLPFVSAYWLAYVVMRYTTAHWVLKCAAAICFGMATACTYFLKPSAIIGAIAIALMLVFRLVRPATWKSVTWKQVTHIGLALGLIAVSAGGVYYQVNTAMHQQTYIKVDWTQTIPAVHFASMGVSGDGGYNADDALAMVLLPTKKAKSDYSIRKLKSRVRRMGALGYAKFLLRKQGNNSADGTFGWLKEGSFFHDKQTPVNKGIKGHLKNYFYLYGEYIQDFRFIAQVGWVIWLGLILLGAGHVDDRIQVLRLAIVGGFLFLLLFEGGRSRYLIQFLPAFLLLGSLTTNRAVMNIQRIWHWFYRDEIPKTA